MKSTHPTDEIGTNTTLQLHSTTLFDKTLSRSIHLVEELTLLPDNLMRRLKKPEGEF